MQIQRAEARAENQSEVSFILPAKEKIADFAAKSRKPFLQPSRLERFNAIISQKAIEALQSLLGADLYIKVFGDEFDCVDAGLKRLLARLLEEGIIDSFNFMAPVVSQWPSIICAGASLSPIALPSGWRQRMSGTTGNGVGLDYNSAAAIALAETLERYSLAQYGSKKFIWDSFEGLKKHGAVDPERFSAFSEKQLEDSACRELHYFNKKTKFNWTPARSLMTFQRVLVPAQLAFLLYERRENEPIIRQTTTSGAAAGSSHEMAVYNAVCEAIERDSLMIFWLNELSPPRLDISSSADEELSRILNQCGRYGIDIAVFDITTDLNIPTVLGVFRDHTESLDAIKIAPRTDLDIDAAIKKAILDCLRAGVMEKIQAEEAKQAALIAPKITSVRQRRALWSNSTQLPDAEFLFRGPVKTPEANKFPGAAYKKKLAALLDILRQKELEVFMVDATAPMAKEAGLTVLMSLIPGLYPLYLDESYKYLGVKRLYETPVKMRYLTAPRQEEEMNLIPHPML